MKSAAGRFLLLVSSVAAMGFGAFGPLAPRGEMNRMVTEHVSQSSSSMSVSGPAVDSASRVIVSRTPFRAARRPAAVAFDPALPEQSAQAASTPKPALTVSGIVWGGDPTAVIQGLPGIEGSKVVRQGDVVGAIRIKRIGRERVWITGLDTTWVLAVREPWK